MWAGELRAESVHVHGGDGRGGDLIQDAADVRGHVHVALLVHQDEGTFLQEDTDAQLTTSGQSRPPLHAVVPASGHMGAAEHTENTEFHFESFLGKTQLKSAEKFVISFPVFTQPNVATTTHVTVSKELNSWAVTTKWPQKLTQIQQSLPIQMIVFSAAELN